jgi:MscS family membrane protein
MKTMPAERRSHRLLLAVPLGALLILIAAAGAGYRPLNDNWIRARLPGPLLHQGLFGLLWWQWLALPVLALVAFVLGRLLGIVSRMILRAVFRRTPTIWDDRLLIEVAPALSVVWSVLVAEALLPVLALQPSAHAGLRSILVAGFVVAVVWVMWSSIYAVLQLILARPWVAHHPSARSLLGIGAGLARVVIVVIGIFVVAAAFGYRLNTALAGLGIGGIAVALGAQKMIENLFGSLALAIDQPFHAADLVTVDGVTGVIERIGVRSTRIRTPDRTLVTIPNGKLADMRIETLAARDRLRMALTLNLAESTSGAQARQVSEGVLRVLKSHPFVWPDSVVVSLVGIGPYSWDIEIVAWFATTHDMEFRSYREEVLLQFMNVVEEAGTNIAWQLRAAPPMRGNQTV